MQVDQKTKTLYLIPTLASGGAERQLVELVDNLNRKRFEPIVCLVYSEQVVPREINPRDCKLINLEKPLGKWGNAVLLYRLRRTILEERPAIIHSYLNQANLYARLGALLSGHSCVVTSVRSHVKGFWKRFDRLAEQILWRISKVIVVNSDQVKSELITELGIPAGRIQVIHNGVNTHRFRPGRDREKARQALGRGGDGFLIGVVSRYSPEKGYDCLLDALVLLRDRQVLPPFKVLCVGVETVPEILENVRRFIQEHKLGRICDMRGPYSRIEDVYAAMDVLVLPSRHEAFPNVVLEAFACGKSVIVSEAANAVGIVRPGVNGWVFPTNDAEALAECLEQAISLRREELDEMGKRGRATVVEKYAVKAMTRQIEAMYARVLGSRDV